jgi:hypothetical protein
MLKNVAGGRVDPWSEPGMKSEEASATIASSAANAPDVAQRLIERTSPVTSANEPGFRNFKRGVINDVPFVRNVSRRLVRRSASRSVIGTETAACAAYAELKGVKG